MLSYSNFKTQLLQMLAKTGKEKHQSVKNVDSQEKAIRKASALPQLAFEEHALTFLKAFSWSFVIEHQLTIKINEVAFLSIYHDTCLLHRLLYFFRV